MYNDAITFTSRNYSSWTICHRQPIAMSTSSPVLNTAVVSDNVLCAVQVA